MGRVVMGGVMPHPAILIEEVGGEERDNARQSVEGLQRLARDLLAADPATLVIISPHGPVFQDAIFILGWEELKGSFANFGAPEVKLSYENDLELAYAIEKLAKDKGVLTFVGTKEEARQFGVGRELDHGVLVPLDFLRRAGFKGKIVVMGMGLFATDELYEFGQAVQAAIEASGKNAAIIASGDLSHRLTPDAPAGYNRRGAEFDEAIVQGLKQADFASILNLDPGLQEAAGECGFRPINMLLGAFDGYKVQTEVYSYEGPFGVGYMVAGITPIERTSSQGGLLEGLRQTRERYVAEVRQKQHPIVKLAIRSLEHYLKTDCYLETADLPAELPERAGVFVSIKRHGQLRGCIGTISPVQPDLAQEVIHNAVSAGLNDPRFFPIELEELPELSFSVDVLGAEEKISSTSQLDPYKYGVIVRQGGRSGLLLPNLEGIDSVGEQVAIAKQKAGIGTEEQVELSRFEVIRFT